MTCFTFSLFISAKNNLSKNMPSDAEPVEVPLFNGFYEAAITSIAISPTISSTDDPLELSATGLWNPQSVCP